MIIRYHGRNTVISDIKGLLIFSVIIVHTHWKHAVALEWFNMPLFFVLSGYLLKIPDKINENKWIGQRTIKFLIPYLVYGCICGAFETNTFEGFKAYIKKLLLGGKFIGGVWWFINVLILSQIFIVIIENHVVNSVIKKGIYILMYLTGIALSWFFIPSGTINVPASTRIIWDLDVCLVAIPYMMVGYYLKCYQQTLPKFIHYYANSVLSIVGTVILFVLLYWTHAEEWFCLDMKYSQYKDPILDMVCPLLIGAAIYYISSIISKYRIGSCIGYIGERSIIIMYLHLLIRDHLCIRLFGDNYPIWIFFITTVFLCMAWDHLIKKLPYSRLLFAAT